MPNEKTWSTHFRKDLGQTFYHNLHGNRFSRQAVDSLIVYRGMPIFIELKTLDLVRGSLASRVRQRWPSEGQLDTLAAMHRAGGKGVIVMGVTDGPRMDKKSSAYLLIKVTDILRSEKIESVLEAAQLTSPKALIELFHDEHINPILADGLLEVYHRGMSVSLRPHDLVEVLLDL